VTRAQLPLRLAFSVSGCCYDPATASGVPKVELTLACAPPAGSVPNSRAACAEIAADVDRFLGPTPSQQCIGGPQPWGMTITGSYRGAAVHREYPNSTCASQADRDQMQAWLSLLRASPIVRAIVANPFNAAPFPPPGTPHLTIGVTRPKVVARTYTLACGPPEGTHPDPAAACRALADYLSRPKGYVRCIGMYVGPVVSVTGTYEGRPLRLGFGWLCGRSQPVRADLRVIGAYKPTEG
jgi:hypothetical protein